VAGGTVRVALRRDGTKRLFLQVVAPPGVDLSDPSTAWAVRRAEVDLREAAGLEGQPTPAPTVPAPPAVTS
jgi:hypothetical protein